VLHVAGYLGHGHDEEVAEGVVLEAALLEAVVEQLLNQRLGVRQGDQALPDVARRQDPVFLTQPPAGAAVVGDGDDRGPVAGVLLQAATRGPRLSIRLE
jgi:hypothetical protein